MSLPRFLDRIVDATSPLLAGLDREAVQLKLSDSSVALVGGQRAASGASRDGFLLAANLLSRLYPSIRLEGPTNLVVAAKEQILLANPVADVHSDGATSATLAYEADRDGGAVVAVSASAWNVFVDATSDSDVEATTPAALLAATLGVGELFRIVFADELGVRGRRARQPGAFNLVTLAEPSFDLPLPDRVDIGAFRLVGAGAIGQAAAHTLARSGAVGTMVAIDHESIALSNLQRYVLTRDADVDAVKVDLLRERLEEAYLEVTPISAKWHSGLVEKPMPTLVALDSPQDRINVQASLPGPIFNAWTQPADVGWSRHEHFGTEEPCLACLYWPQREIPSRHEEIAAAFSQHPLRVLGYLVRRLPIGLPLPLGGVPAVAGLEAPSDVESWYSTPLVDDIAFAAGIDPGELTAWRDRALADVYQDGICGGALLHLNVGTAPRDVLVPLAHQSAFAGVMLATQLLISRVPALAAARATVSEARFDVLAGLPQVLGRPRTPTPGCICEDVVFRSVWDDKVKKAAGAPGAAAEGLHDTGSEAE